MFRLYWLSINQCLLKHQMFYYNNINICTKIYHLNFEFNLWKIFYVSGSILGSFISKETNKYISCLMIYSVDMVFFYIYDVTTVSLIYLIINLYYSDCHIHFQPLKAAYNNKYDPFKYLHTHPLLHNYSYHSFITLRLLKTYQCII